jgi:hypothetical protein
LKTNILEKDIQRAICDYLALRRYFFYRNNNTPIYDVTRKTFRAMPKYTPRGICDIIIIAKGGKYIGLEVKTKTGTQSEPQIIFEQNVKKAGGEYHIVRSLEDVQKIGL